jgi:hypothetical protein
MLAYQGNASEGPWCYARPAAAAGEAGRGPGDRGVDALVPWGHDEPLGPVVGAFEDGGRSLPSRVGRVGRQESPGSSNAAPGRHRSWPRENGRTTFRLRYSCGL